MLLLSSLLSGCQGAGARQEMRIVEKFLLAREDETLEKICVEKIQVIARV